jgi:hypothetical protein
MNGKDVVKASKIVNPILLCFRATDEDTRVEVVVMGLLSTCISGCAKLNTSSTQPATALEPELQISQRA